MPEAGLAWNCLLRIGDSSFPLAQSFRECWLLWSFTKINQNPAPVLLLHGKTSGCLLCFWVFLALFQRNGRFAVEFFPKWNHFICWIFVCVLQPLSGKRKKSSGKSCLRMFLSYISPENAAGLVWSILQSGCSPLAQPWESIYFTHQLHTWHFNTVALILMDFRNCIMIREKCFIQEGRHQSLT